MHPIKITDGEMALLKQAADKKDWKILPTWKLKYLYQRCIALPAKDMKTVREIGEVARGRNRVLG